MKKLFSVLVALTFVLSLAAVAVAADKPASAAPAAEPAKAAVPAKPEPAKKMEGKKEKSHQITGIVEAVDDAAGTLTVKGKKGSANLKAGEKVTLAKIKVGDKVLVNYSGDTASSVKKVAEKKATPRKTAKKSQPKMAEPAKKEMAPAETAPPAGK
jgi:hypothetical protein